MKLPVFLFVLFFCTIPTSGIAQEKDLSPGDDLIQDIAEGNASENEDIEVEDFIEENESDEDNSDDFLESEVGQEISPMQLPGFLFALHLGPFFSFGEWIGVLSEVEFQFRLKGTGYLSIIGSFRGGYQMSTDRNDYLISGTLGYRHYFHRNESSFWTILGGCNFGYFTTSGDRYYAEGYDWMHLGLRAMGGHYWFMGDRFSIGVEGGLLLAYQFSEFFDEDPFTVVVPEILLSITL